MAEDWRVTLTLEDDGGLPLLDALRELRLEREIRERLGGRVSVSGGGGGPVSPDRTVFLYAASEEAARAAAGVVEELLRSRGETGSFALDRWHPDEERWEPASLPLPRTEAEREAEHLRLVTEETAEALDSGEAVWEVRLELPGRAEAAELAERLEAEGLAVARRWRHVMVGATNRDEAAALAERLAAEAPAGTRVEVGQTGAAVWEVQPANPFAVFGGLGL